MSAQPRTVTDLAAERARATFPVAALTNLLDGGAERTALRHKLEGIIQRDPTFRNDDLIFLSRPERYTRGIAKAARFMELVAELKLSDGDRDLLHQAVHDDLPTDLNMGMFAPNVRALGTDEQRDKWAVKADFMEIIGCYAQTELGHGSNVRGLETTATFIPETDEWDVHSPSLSAAKWWPGTLGRTANHAVVYARMVVAGKDHGVHQFVVPIRDPATHLPLRGVRVGDIGPKIGFNNMDNGFCLFEHVRVPRGNLLMRYVHVDKNGTITRPKVANDKISYITMMQVRTVIVRWCYSALGRAVTITTRYSAVRRQGFNEDGTSESQIIDYTQQQYRIFPLIAATYAFFFQFGYLSALFRRLLADVNSGDMALLPEMHATLSALKSLTTKLAADGIEECRRACGGHGYLLSSGLPELLGTFLQNCTVEGDNYVLTQQTGRYLLKQLAAAQAGQKIPGIASYLQNFKPGARFGASTPEEARDPRHYVAAFRHRAARLVVYLGTKMQESLAAGRTQEVAWNGLLVEINRVSRAHGMLSLILAFTENVQGVRNSNPALEPVLRALCDLFALYYLEQDAVDFIEDGYMTFDQLEAVRAAVRGLLTEVRPNAVALVDALDHSDHALKSALGVRDGNVYQALWDSAQKSPLNAQEPCAAYEQSLKPLFAGRIRSKL